jgi:UDP-N-acetylglucosamine--N-acetylmuramyl-(pentapeptide) pyrophosphoryl-undecaprenol N-acetylglucosamine transferase
MEQSRKKEVRVLFTGGHAATTAAAVIEEINLSKRGWRLYWIGVRNAIEGKKMATLESEMLPGLGVRFLPLITGRIQRRFTLWTIPSLFKIPLGFIQSFYYLVKIKPKVVLSFGGFVSFPVVFSAWLLRIPVVIHEQTAAVGRANKLSAHFASKIALAREGSIKYFPFRKCIITGNPVRKDITKVKFKSKMETPPTIFVTCGSRGSQVVNGSVGGILRTLLGRYKVIHQTGTIDIRKFSDIKQKLPQALRKNYEVIARIDSLNMPKVYQRSDIVVSGDNDS